MKHKFLILTLLMIGLGFFNGYAQSCNCEENFNWVKKTFEENDAGFKYALSVKGKQAYEDHNKRILEKIKTAKTLNECAPILYEWLEFFRSGHIAIRLTNQNSNNNTNTTAVATSSANYDNWETLKVNLPEFEKYLANKKEQDLEGIWVTEPYKIGIKKVKNDYIGFIIESGADTWKKDQVKLKVTHKNNKLYSTFYMRDHSAVESDKVEPFGKNTLQLGNTALKRVYPKLEEDKDIKAYSRIIEARKPFMEKLDDKTVYIRIPSFNVSSKKDIDSVLNLHRATILKTENLILDIRYGTGGSDSSFGEIIPFIYTNPIRTVGVEYYSTKLNNQRMLDFISKPEYGFDEDDKKWAKKAYDTLEKHLGTFMSLNKYPVSEEKLDTIHEYPKNVGIIINKNNGSTDEQFLLAAKQSKKVKLFGTTTHGVLDISNMYFVPSPCKEFELGYSLSRSKRIPDFPIDEIGIQPDFYIDESIPKYKWVEFVSGVLNNK
ncbi:S41 family peptidase [Pedobacter montanisoli]|uniref:S41 family peptidase n=1 Tax=Pedobacter montanisoli TaxID=2923277 RepID=A0ABS9ZX77_9SPHI|nr:S41 family peptidase [Pedobacter montanisoli]MCJ0742915.1 S41 family peptidase [Pedobacter montanisoli]